VVLGNAVIRRGLSIALLVLGLTGCGSPEQSASPLRALGPGEQWLPVAHWGQSFLCAGGGYVGDFRLHGSPDDPRLAWMTWPEGSMVTGGCGTGETNVSYVDFTTPRPDATDVPVDGPVR
jgi:hypothetical protein